MLPEVALAFTGIEHHPYPHSRARPCVASWPCSPIPRQSSGKNAEGWWPQDELSGEIPTEFELCPYFCSLQEGGSCMSGAHHSTEGSLLAVAWVGPRAPLGCWLAGGLHPLPHQWERGEAEGRSFTSLHKPDLCSHTAADGNLWGEWSPCSSG